MSTEQWFPVISLSPVEEEWRDALAGAIREIDPDPAAADAVLRDVFQVPLPRDPRDDFEPPAEDVLSQRESDECADRAEARETAQRGWRGSDG